MLIIESVQREVQEVNCCGGLVLRRCMCLFSRDGLVGKAQWMSVVPDDEEGKRFLCQLYLSAQQQRCQHE